MTSQRKPTCKRIIRGKRWKEHYIAERKALRRIAVLNQIREGKLGEAEVLKVFEHFGIRIDIIPSIFQVKSIFKDKDKSIHFS
jgi:hypothetical protein